MHVEIARTTVCIHVPFPRDPFIQSVSRSLSCPFCSLSAASHTFRSKVLNLLSVPAPVGIRCGPELTWWLSEALFSARSLWHPRLCPFPFSSLSHSEPRLCPSLCWLLLLKSSSVDALVFSHYLHRRGVFFFTISFPPGLLNVPPKPSPERGLVVRARGPPLCDPFGIVLI